jgi:uncharacterized membrane protein
MLAYGIAGWCLEIVFTAACGAVAERDRRLRGETYLWMLPIYGGGGLLMEELQRTLAPQVPRPIRAIAYLGAIYAIEYGSGRLLRRLLGQCPWDYQDRGLNVDGLIRLDFMPFWYAAALAFEPVRGSVARLLAPGVEVAER